MHTPGIRPKLSATFLPAVVVAAAWLTSGCGSHAAPQVMPETRVTYEQKMGWILRLEDHRILRDPETSAGAAAAAGPVTPAAGTAGQVMFATTLPLRTASNACSSTRTPAFAGARRWRSAASG